MTNQETAKKLRSMEDILFLCHAEPDGDTIGSALALALGMKSLGKRVRIASADPIPAKYDYLDLSPFEEEFVPQFVVSVDVADFSLLGSLKEKYPNIHLAIDHHQSHRPFAEELCLAGEACACALLVFELLEELGVSINRTMADALYTGLATDSGCFRYSSTTPKAHRAAALLIEAGANFDEINRKMFETKSFARIQLETLCMKKLSLHLDGLVALSVLTKEELNQISSQNGDMDGIAALPRSVEGVEIGILVRQKEENLWKVSLRTNQAADASAICAVFGGGGHLHAAGCQFEGATPDQGMETLLSASKAELVKCQMWKES